VQEFNDSLGIPRGLAALGVTEAAIPDLVKGAILDPSCGGNPVALTEENLTALFHAAM
jgi:alcohol dehydrogenase class IV